MEQIIKYKTALLAKEKGFDEQTSELWVQGEGEEPSTVSDWEISKGKWDEDWYKDLGFYAATQSLLQKWLRNIHHIHIDIQLGHDEDNMWFNPHIYKMELGYAYDSIDLDIDGQSSYEDALEVGLMESLKLIK